MHKINKKAASKILILSFSIVFVLNIFDIFINANALDTNKNNQPETNSSKFEKISKNSLGKAGVAISTNLGTRSTEKENIETSIYKDVFTINELISRQEVAKNEIIKKNMIILQDYRNMLGVDFKKLLLSSRSKSATIEAYTDQILFRIENGNSNINLLQRQKESFLNEMENIEDQISSLKEKTEKDFRENNPEKSLENIEKYLELKNKFFYARTYVIYINNFLSQYQVYNNYGNTYYDTIINNKDALIKNSFVVIPDSGTAGLKNLDLLFTEEEFKN